MGTRQNLVFFEEGMHVAVIENREGSWAYFYPYDEQSRRPLLSSPPAGAVRAVFAAQDDLAQMLMCESHVVSLLRLSGLWRKLSSGAGRTVSAALLERHLREALRSGVAQKRIFPGDLMDAASFARLYRKSAPALLQEIKPLKRHDPKAARRAMRSLTQQALDEAALPGLVQYIRTVVCQANRWCDAQQALGAIQMHFPDSISALDQFGALYEESARRCARLAMERGEPLAKSWQKYSKHKKFRDNKLSVKADNAERRAIKAQGKPTV